MSGVQGVSFTSNYIIPFNEVKDSATMRQLGAESAKFIKGEEDVMQTKEGMVIKVDDARDKEYEAVIAKYGINIKKYDGAFKPNADLDSYAFMVSKLYPEEEAQKKLEAYKAMNKEEKNKEYLSAYGEFKNSKHSVENQANLPKPKLTPTEKPIIKYESKDGEKFMAREVMLENGYKCMAVSNEKNPGQATLMNHEEFMKLLAESAKQAPKS